MSSIDHLLPPSLLLGPHLSAYRYFFVCTLTIASWDTLVLTTRSWRMSKSKEWPVLKIIMLLLRHLMPIEFIVLAVSCFNPAFTPAVCKKSYLFEPIMTAILMSLSSLALVIRVRAIHEAKPAVSAVLATLLILQIALHFAASFFYFPLNLQNQQGCIAAPKHAWVGVYWVGPTLLYAVCFALAVQRSIASLKDRPIGWWKLINRDGLNLYATIFGINFINLIYFFVTKPNNDADPLRIIVSSLATVLTTTMTMRVILLVRGSLVAGGSFHGSTAPTSSMSGGGGGNGTHNGTSGGQGFHITGGASSGAAGGGRSKGTNAVPSIPGSRNTGGNPLVVGGGGAGGEAKNKMSQPTFAIARHPRGVGSDGGDGVYDVDVEDVDVYQGGDGKKGSLGGLAGEEEEVWQGDKQ